jgi:hypothetical protein
MKQILPVVLAAILLNTSIAHAQTNVFAYNGAVKSSDNIGTPETGTPFKLDVSQTEQEPLIFRVTVENPGSERVLLTIKDANNVTLHQESLPATLVYKARFNMEGLQDGDYTFEIRKGKSRLAEKQVSIKTETSINRVVSIQ